MDRFTLVVLLLGALSLSGACAESDLSAGLPAQTTTQQVNKSREEIPSVLVRVDASLVQRTLTRQILGQGVWYSWQSYAWDHERQRTWPEAMARFADVGMGIVGHYPGVGVITHDFHWKNVVGPLETRTDPTPRQSSFDTPQFLEFGPDEYGRFVEEYRTETGLPVQGSIQVNIVSGSAREAADWVEYMNAPNDGSNPGGGIDWAAVRAANGHSEPYRILYWELGNEPHFTASGMGSLSAQEYVNRIRAFVPLMKERDPSIKVMAYVNPFQIGDPDKLGTATSGIPAGRGLTWTQTIIQNAGESLDHVYFHWYGGWNDRIHDYEFFATSMYTGLVPLLDRLLSDIDEFAPSDAARSRLQQIFIPEWNVYGGWAKPLARGSALQGALAYSRTLHVFASREEIYSAQHLGLFAPYPDPSMRLGLFFDIREGYFTFWGTEDESDFIGTALAPVTKLWSKTFASETVSTSVSGDVPAFENEVDVLDVTALRASDGSRLNLVLTNAGHVPLEIRVNISNFDAKPSGLRLSLEGENDLSVNNSWQDKDRVVLEQGVLSIVDSAFSVRIPAYSVTGVLLEGTP